MDKDSKGSSVNHHLQNHHQHCHNHHTITCVASDTKVGIRCFFSPICSPFPANGFSFVCSSTFSSTWPGFGHLVGRGVWCPGMTIFDQIILWNVIFSKSAFNPFSDISILFGSIIGSFKNNSNFFVCRGIPGSAEKPGKNYKVGRNRIYLSTCPPFPKAQIDSHLSPLGGRAPREAEENVIWPTETLWKQGFIFKKDFNAKFNSLSL